MNVALATGMLFAQAAACVAFAVSYRAAGRGVLSGGLH